MKRIISTGLFLMIFIFLLSSYKENTTPNLDQLFDAYSDEHYALNPLAATQQGIHKYDDKMEIKISDEYIKQSISLNQKYLQTLERLDKAALTANEILSVDILIYKLHAENEWFNNELTYYNPINQFVFSFPTQFATLGSGAGYVPFNTEMDYRNFISRMKIFQSYVDQAIVNMQKGIALNNTTPKAAMVKVPAQLKPLFEGDNAKNVFYKTLSKLPDDLDSLAAKKLVEDYSNAIENILKPAYKKLHDYIVEFYIPKARETTGLVDNHNGKTEYQAWLKYHTTTDITPETIFNLGLKEVARIHNEMDSVKKVVGYEGDLKSFFEYVKSAPKFFPFKTEDEILDRFRSFEKEMEPQLNRLFNMKPKAKFEVRATEKFRAAGANAQYIKGSRDGQRPGIFYEAVIDPTKYNYFSMEALFIHEAIPGHHYQVSIQQEANIPEFRITYGANAFGEGWALYTESLGKELGMYKDPYQYFGRLNSEIERAVRLVVDVGIHDKGWSREKAISYILENQPVSASQAEQRVERYMVIPGQAVSYKVGEIKILELREKARQRLGDQFDIKAFHDEVLKDGSVPLIILEKKINDWIIREESRK